MKKISSREIHNTKVHNIKVHNTKSTIQKFIIHIVKKFKYEFNAQKNYYY
jgi:hypothetical protein